MEKENSCKIYYGQKKAELLSAYGFKKFTAETIPLYETYKNQMNGSTGSYMRSANILCWGFYSIPYYMIYKDFFLIVNDDGYYESFIANMPVGNYENHLELKECFLFMEQVFDALGIGGIYLQGKDWMKPYLDEIQDLSFQWEYFDSESDYLYPLDELQVSMNRRKVHYEKKIQTFMETYNPTIELFHKKDYEACLSIIHREYCENGECESCIFGCMREWFSILVKNLETLLGEIYVIKSNNQVIGYITMIMDEDLLYFDRKATHNLNGLTEYLNAFIVEKWGKTYSIMNFEEDMGSVGLRRHKKALGPYQLSKNYRICIKK